MLPAPSTRKTWSPFLGEPGCFWVGMDSHHVGIAPRIITLRSGAPPRIPALLIAHIGARRGHRVSAESADFGCERRRPPAWPGPQHQMRAPDLLRRLQRRRLGGEPEPRRPLEQEV